MTLNPQLPSNGTDSGIRSPLHRKAWQTWAFRLVGPFIFFLLITHFDFRNAIKLIRDLKPLYFIAALAFFLPLNWFKSLRWSVLLKQFGINRDVITLFNLNVASFAPSVLSPGRTGEFIKVLPLVDKDCSMTTALGSGIIDRVFDLFFVLILGAGGMFLFFETSSAVKIILAIIIMILIIIIGVKYHSLILHRVKFIPYISELIEPLESTLAKLSTVSVVSWTKMIIWTFLVWSSYYLSIIILVIALQIPMKIGVIFLIFSSIAVLNLVPVSIAGLGTRDALLVLYFSKQGWPAEQALALASSILALLMVEAGISFIYFTILSWLWPYKYKEGIK